MWLLVTHSSTNSAIPVKSCAAPRYGSWFDNLVSVPGAVTSDGPSAAGFVVPLVRDGACICVDSIGIGSSALDFLVGLNLNVLPVVGSEASSSADKAGQLRFRNKRAEMYWRLREALDPLSARSDWLCAPQRCIKKLENLAHPLSN